VEGPLIVRVGAAAQGLDTELVHHVLMVAVAGELDLRRKRPGGGLGGGNGELHGGHGDAKADNQKGSEDLSSSRDVHSRHSELLLFEDTTLYTSCFESVNQAVRPEGSRSPLFTNNQDWFTGSTCGFPMGKGESTKNTKEFRAPPLVFVVCFVGFVCGEGMLEDLSRAGIRDTNRAGSSVCFVA